MKVRHRQPARLGLFVIALVWIMVVLPLSAKAAPYAALVMDARTGEVLHAENADARLHPASLTKMMTLYIAFQAIESGQISLDTEVKISAKAAAQPPSKLGLRAGQKIKLRYLIRAAAVKSANDAATAIGEAIEGSEAAFARRMNRTAKAMGMTRTTFKNMNGLTQEGHLSTARDMTVLGRHLLYDFPDYYNLFSRRTADAGMGQVNNTNRRLLDAYKGADGIKTGYTRAAGFNLVASAERGDERIIATVFGGRSTVSRNARVAELLDLGFRRAPSVAPTNRPARPMIAGNADPEGAPVQTAQAIPGTAGKTIRLKTTMSTSLRPVLRPGAEQAAPPVLLAMKDDIKNALTEAVAGAVTEAVSETVVAKAETVAPDTSRTPKARPVDLVLASAAPIRAPRPSAQPAEQRIVERVSTSGGRHWGINVGRFPNRYRAEKALLKTALAEMNTLDGSLRKVVERKGGFDANFMGLSRETADLACRRLQARKVTCFMIGPS